MPPAESPASPGTSTVELTCATVDADVSTPTAGNDVAAPPPLPSTLDVSDNCLELGFPSPAGGAEPSALLLYKNTINLIPRAVRDLGGLKVLKLFSNDINVLPAEVAEDLPELECLQVKISPPSLSSLPLQKLVALKELELYRVPSPPSAVSVLTEIAGFKLLTRLALCNFAIRFSPPEIGCLKIYFRFLPPEIGCLKKLKALDLSFNKLKRLPDEISLLEALISLRVANNKLAELPTTLSCLNTLEDLDVSNNRLASLQSLDFSSMHALKNLNIQCNKMLCYSHVPSRICCKSGGIRKKAAFDEVDMSVVEVDDDVLFLDAESCCSFDSLRGSSSISEASSSSSRSSLARRSRKGGKPRDHIQRCARQERLLNSRLSNTDNHNKVNLNMVKDCCQRIVAAHESIDGPDNLGKRDFEALSSMQKSKNCTLCKENEDECTSTTSELVVQNKKFCCKCEVEDSKSIRCVPDESGEQSFDVASVESSFQQNSKPKRHSDINIDNPKPRKCLKPVGDSVSLSQKYNRESFCSVDDCMPDGFYDAGHCQPFMTLERYDQILPFDSREVILVDRQKDEQLDTIVVAAQVLLSSLRWSHESANQGDDNLQRASVLALFVSDCFGGSDRSHNVMKARKAVSGSIYEQPFVCSCLGEGYKNEFSKYEHGCFMDDINFNDLLSKSLGMIKRKKNSNIVPIGSLRIGVCRHRALLMKYLCDRARPPIPCELVRGYYDFFPHAWNTVLVQKGDLLVRMIVDACCPTDIREEQNPEYFSRYIPFSRIHGPASKESGRSTGDMFSSTSLENAADRASRGIVVPCKFGNTMAAIKVKNFDKESASEAEIKNFEFSCLGELRMLGALRNHPCIVKVYGHQLISKWAPARNSGHMHRSLQFRLIMEYIKGGSLKLYLDKLVQRGEKHVPVDIALIIARAVASALVEVHAKKIIHRDIKSYNVLIDLNDHAPDGTPVVKLCDFDTAVPLHSKSHSCVIAHLGVSSLGECVGTLAWMAPEVLHVKKSPNRYGLEADIWSYGCLLLEMLTLKAPYASLSQEQHDHFRQIGQRPPLTPDLAALVFPEESIMSRSDSDITPSSLEDTVTLKFLVELFLHCTKTIPSERPTAQAIYDMICAQQLKNNTTVAE